MDARHLHKRSEQYCTGAILRLPEINNVVCFCEFSPLIIFNLPLSSILTVSLHLRIIVLFLGADFAYSLLPYLADQTSTRLSVSLTSGLVAGVCAAIVSQPGERRGQICFFYPCPS